MKVELKGRVIPRNDNGDPQFVQLGEFLKPEDRNPKGDLAPPTLLDVFTPQEIVELVNRALYQIEYQRESHKKRGKEERERNARLKEALKAQGLDPKKMEIEKQLGGNDE